MFTGDAGGVGGSKGGSGADALGACPSVLELVCFVECFESAPPPAALSSHRLLSVRPSSVLLLSLEDRLLTNPDAP